MRHPFQWILGLFSIVAFSAPASADWSYMDDWSRNDYSFQHYREKSSCGSFRRYSGSRGKFHLDREERQFCRQRMNGNGGRDRGDRTRDRDRREARGSSPRGRQADRRRHFRERLDMIACGYCYDEFYRSAFDKSKNSNLKKDLNKERFAACELAVKQAFQFAKYFDGAEGGHDGFLRGYQCAAKTALGDNTYPSGGRPALLEYNDGKSQVAQNLNSEINRKARATSFEPGQWAGAPKGTGRAVGQFRDAAINNAGKVPPRNVGDSDAYVEYSGVNNGYELTAGGYDGRTLPRPGDLIEDLDLDPYRSIRSREGYRGRSDYYSDHYSRHQNRYRTRHYFPGSSIVDYGYKRRYGNVFYGSEAFRRWHLWARDRHFDRYDNFSRQSVVATVIVTPESTDAEGNVIAAKTRQVTDESPRDVFVEAFKDAYRYWAPRSYQRGFRLSLDDGWQVGYPVGVDAGRLLSNYVGQKAEYDARFLTASIKFYKDGFSETFESNYNSTYDSYKEGSAPEALDAKSVICKDNDGICTEGEALAVKANVRNIGGQTAYLDIGVNGRSIGEGGKSTDSIEVAPISTKSFTTSFMSAIPDDIIPADSSSATYKIKIVDVNDPDTLFDEISILVRNIFGLQENQPVATENIAKGEISVPVSVSNPRSIDSKEEAIAELWINGEKVDEQNLGVLKAGTSKTGFLKDKFADPLAMIETGRFQVNVVLKVDGEQMQAKRAKGIQIKKYDAKIEYYFALLAERANYPGRDDDATGELYQARIAELHAGFRAEEAELAKALLKDITTYSGVTRKMNDTEARNPYHLNRPQNRSVLKDLTVRGAHLEENYGFSLEELSERGQSALGQLTNDLMSDLHQVIYGKDTQKARNRAKKCKSVYCAYGTVRKGAAREKYMKHWEELTDLTREITGNPVTEEELHQRKWGDKPMCSNMEFTRSRSSRAKCICYTSKHPDGINLLRKQCITSADKAYEEESGKKLNRR